MSHRLMVVGHLMGDHQGQCSWLNRQFDLLILVY